MTIAGVLATSILVATIALFASDSRPGRAVLYAVRQWRRRQRHGRLQRNRLHP